MTGGLGTLTAANVHDITQAAYPIRKDGEPINCTP